MPSASTRGVNWCLAVDLEFADLQVPLLCSEVDERTWSMKLRECKASAYAARLEYHSLVESVSRDYL